MQRFSLFLIALLLWLGNPLFSCTTILVTREATADGSCFVTHSDDNELQDERIIYVPAQDYPEGSKRELYPYLENYPRYVGKSRGPNYENPSFPPTESLGSIDQVPHTYAYFDAGYGIMNEHQLSIGESTCVAKFSFDPEKGKRIIDIAEMSRIALERCTNAKDAVLLIGPLAEKYGYYGWGECLLIADKTEGWVFEICSTPSGTGAIWVAKKVPDGEVFVSANEFRIREIDPKDPNILYSSNLFQAIQEAGWWSPDSKKSLDWLKAVSPGEYNHPYYSLRRIWRVQTLLNPSLHLSPWVEDGFTKDYPFSIKPAHKLSLQEVIRLHRDYYEGTEFDLRKGLASGPFGSPYRWMGKEDHYHEFGVLKENPMAESTLKKEGAWERPISVYYIGYSWVCQIRPWLPDAVGGIAWISLDQPATSYYTPFYAGIQNLPDCYQKGSPYSLKRESAWWAANVVSNWADVKFSYIYKDIQAKQKEVERKIFTAIAAVDKKAMALYQKDPKAAREYLTGYCNTTASEMSKTWWSFADFLVEKYIDGYVNKPNIRDRVGYPKEWEKAVGYGKGPISYQKNMQ